jgi:hypothetical protein
MSSETKTKQSKKKELKITKPLKYKDFDIDTKIYIKTAQIMHKCGVDYNKNNEVVKSFIEKLKGLFGSGATHHQLEALEFILAGKPKDMIEIHHLLNLFITSDYMRICRLYMYSNTATQEQNQEYIRLSGKIMEQYSKGMLSLKMYREGIPQIQNNKIQNNTLNQLNIHSQKEEESPKAVECNESANAEKVAIKKKEEV